MHVSIYGTIDVDVVLVKMIAVRDACDAAGVDYPSEVKSYLGCYVNEMAQTILEEKTEIDLSKLVKEVPDPDSNIAVIQVADIPKEVKAIKVMASY